MPAALPSRMITVGAGFPGCLPLRVDQDEMLGVFAEDGDRPCHRVQAASATLDNISAESGGSRSTQHSPGDNSSLDSGGFPLAAYSFRNS